MSSEWIEWKALSKAESDARKALESEFDTYESGIAGLYNVVERVLDLCVSRQGFDTRVVGACLVRALNDLRAVWLLSQLGYSSQAAAVAASCWEYSMTAEAIAGSEDAAREFLDHGQGTSSWSPKQLAKRVLKRRIELVPELLELTPERQQALWATNYVLYCWLCQIKHPTEDALLHAAAAKTDWDGRLIVTGGPDSGPDDANLRGVVLAVTANAVGAAIGGLLGAIRADAEPNEWKSVSTAWSESLVRFRFRDESELPISLEKSPFRDEFRRLYEDAIHSEETGD